MDRIANFGWVLGRAKTNNQGKINELCLVCPSDASEHVFSPAQSVTIGGPLVSALDAKIQSLPANGDTVWAVSVDGQSEVDVQAIVSRLREWLRTHNLQKVRLLGVQGGVSIEALSVEQMAKFGWVRK